MLLDVASVPATSARPKVSPPRKPCRQVLADGQPRRIGVSVRRDGLHHNGERTLRVAFRLEPASTLLSASAFRVWRKLDDVVPAAVAAVAQQWALPPER